MNSTTKLKLKKPVIQLKRLSEDEILSNVKRLRTSDQQRCEICRQWMDRLLVYAGHPKESILEEDAIQDETIHIDLGDDQLPQFKVTSFSFYDEKNHLVSLDAGLIESSKAIYMSGYIKAISSDDAQEGVPIRNVGPIRQWWNGGFDGGSRNVIGVASDKAEYYLFTPAADFKPLWNEVQEKSFLAKVVIEFLENARDNGLHIVYDDLISKICEVESVDGIILTPESLVKHSAFVLEQVLSYDKALDSEDIESLSLYPLLLSKCMVHLIKFSGLQSIKSKALPCNKTVYSKKLGSKATTTPLVKKMFESLFREQMSEYSCLQNGEVSPKKVSSNNKEETLNGRPPPDGDAEEISFDDATNVKLMNPKAGLDNFFESALIKEVEYKSGDYVLVRPSDPYVPLCIAFLVNFHKDDEDFPMAHCIWFSYAKDTILGEMHNKKEIFLLKECENIPASAIERKTSVSWYRISSDWSMHGGTEKSLSFPSLASNGELSFFYRLLYDEKACRFELCRKDVKDYCFTNGECGMCVTDSKGIHDSPLMVSESEVLINGTKYCVNDAVFLSPSTFDFYYSYSSVVNEAKQEAQEKSNSPEILNEDTFPEKHRKQQSTKNTNSKICEPFCIGIICDIRKLENEDVILEVRIMYRPENTYLIKYFLDAALLRDLNLLYWSDDKQIIEASSVKGKCIVRPKDSIPSSVDEWTRNGEYRFYFSEKYQSDSENFTSLPLEAMNFPENVNDTEDCNRLPNVQRPLRTLDVFAGCGGLSLGLHEAGISEPCWAIENDKSASRAYKENNKGCVVLDEDCNKILEDVMNGKLSNEFNQKLPQKGDVELLVGGPPCQGYSGLNRFNDRQASFFKNSLIATYLAFCDFYRPKYFILENVRNFAFFNNSSILKMCLSTLVRMGYQCTFAVLQAGMYGVPQSRRRSILIAAAPNEVLPMFPKATHAFESSSLSVHIDNKLYNQGWNWEESAPYRAITVRDAISDLSFNDVDEQEKAMIYKSQALSYFQKRMRSESSVLMDHVTKQMTPLIEARISLIPTKPGSDWRDLPNIRMKLKDGTFSNILMYPYYYFRQGSKTSARKRGVCRCAKSSKSQCDPADRQTNTLIPWCLPHTANRNGQWQGLYGRLEWDSFFQTTVTNPEPMGKQGRVLHPEKHRLVSVRECARSQGFPDCFKFFGKITDKYKQIGNAVPPPLGYAIGIEIRKALAESRFSNL